MSGTIYDAECNKARTAGLVRFSGCDGVSPRRYCYANDNPYRFTDPDGRYGCGEKTDCKQVGDVVSTLNSSMSSPALKPSEVSRVQKVSSYIGGPNGKGPTFTAASLPGKKMANSNQRGTIKIDLNKSMPGMDKKTAEAIATAHEADHDVYAKANGEAHTPTAFKASEEHAYGTEAIVAKGLGVSISSAEIKAAVQKSVEEDIKDEPKQDNQQ